MVGITFARPVGPYADTKELEYISSLHQTGKRELRQDGTIHAKDVKHFLCSRHGVRVDEDLIRSAIIQELAGSTTVASDEKKEQAVSTLQVVKGNDAKPEDTVDDDGEEDSDDEDEDEPHMDLSQVLALLMIPFLRGGNPDGYEQEAVGKVVEIALESIWAELRAHSVHVEEKDKEEGVLVTVNLLREIMDIFGEFNLPDNILQEMIAAASGNNNQDSPHFYMTKASFLQALTADTQLWNPNVDQTKSTHFDDARKAWEANLLLGETKMMQEGSRKHGNGAVEDPIPRKRKQEIKEGKDFPFQQLYTAANIDNSADTYRSTAWFVLVWTSTIFIYFCYVSGFQHKIQRIQGCDKHFGCDIAIAILNWLIIALELMICGWIWIMMANLGNSTSPTETIIQKLRTSFRMMWGMLVVIVVTVLSFFYEFNIEILNTTKYDGFEGGYVIVLIMGLCILLLQSSRFLSMYVSLGPFTKGSQEDKERRTKLAASAKTLKFVEHATMLHVSPDAKGSVGSSLLRKSTVSESVTDVSRKLHRSSTAKSSSTKSNVSSSAKVLLHYSHMQDYEEESGGIIWTWKALWNGTLFNEEGIYLHGRLLAVNAVQFLISFFLIGYVVTLLQYFEELIEPVDDGCTFRVNGILVASEAPDLVDSLGALYGNATQFWDDVGEGASNFTFADGLETAANLTEEGLTFINETVGIQNLESILNSTTGFRDILFNLNETHFASAGGDIYLGQIPRWNGTAFSNGAVTLCWDFYITNGTDVWENSEAVENSVKEALELEKWEYTLAFAVGLTAAIFSALSICFVFIPSFVSWVLKYRSGFVPSLKGNYVTYLQYRKSPDQTAVIWGSAFWGILASSGLVFLLFGGVTFLLAWKWTREFIKTVLAQYIGIAATIAIKVIIMMLLRNLFYAGGFYRRRPASSNIMNVLLEAWYLGLSIGVVTSRMIKLLVVTCFYIGRIDTPILAPGVGIGGTNLDTSPEAFRKDMLLHEAHRHPFLERLGLLYLLKLFNGKNFATRAGAYWRILFVLAIFPWMRTYRIASTKGNLLRQVDNDLSEEEEENDDELNESLQLIPRSWNASESIESLAAKRRALKNQLKDLNNLLAEKLDDIDAARAAQQSQLMDDRSISNLRGIDV